MAADHVLDPLGEVILVVCNPNAPFAQPLDEQPGSSKTPTPPAESTESAAERPAKRAKLSSETPDASTHPNPEDPEPNEI
jgi:hypothetical protein